MKLNKKICSLMIVLCMGSAFVGCSKKEEPTPPNVNIEQKDDVTVEKEEEPTESTEAVTDDVETDETEEGEMVEKTFTDDTKSGAIINQIIADVELPKLMAYDEVMLNDIYGIDATTVESYAVGQAMMNVQATEIAIFELKEDTDKEKLLEALEVRQQFLITQWESYLPDQLELVQNYKVVENGNLVLFAINENVDTLVDNFLSISQ